MRIFALLALVFSTYCMQAQSGDRLVSWFSFDTTVLNDKAGNGSIGTPVNDPLLACGVTGSSARFDGVDDAILFLGPINEVFGAGDFSVSFYVKPFEQPGTQLIMAKQDMGCSDRPSFWVRYKFSNNSIAVGIAESDTLFANVTGSLDDDPCWQHVTIVRAQADLRLYVNGVLKDTQKSSARVDLTSAEILRIGEPICPTDRAFRGDLDELRVYNKALSKDEIEELGLHPDQIVNRDTLVYLGGSIPILTSSSCANTFEWVNTDGVSDPAAANPIITPTMSGTYELAFKHSNCIAYDRINVTVIDPLTLDCKQIFIPNAFTPVNSSGLNDRFAISNPFAITDFISFEIFDRWGGRVFSAMDQFDGWDGNFGNTPANAGMYLYRIRYNCQGTEEVRNGSLVLLR